MVSLFSLSEVTEEGVRFRSPYDGKETLLSPERSVEIQNALGKKILGHSPFNLSVAETGPWTCVWFGTSTNLVLFTQTK